MTEKRAHVLFLTQVLPYPLTAGPKVRAYYMLRYLAQNHDVTLVSFVRDDDMPEAIAHLRTFCSAVHTVPMVRAAWRDGFAFLRSFLSGTPALVLRDRVPAMFDLLRRLARTSPFDVVHADQTYMAQYALFARDAHETTAPPGTLLDQHNAMYLLVKRQSSYESGPLRFLWQREARLLRPYEADLIRQFDHVLTVTAEDKEALLALFPTGEQGELGAKFTTLPICVDPEAEAPVTYEDQGPHILHLGTMFWPPNVEGVLWFAQEVLPRVLDAVPDAHFTIAGKNPPPAVTALSTPPSPVAGHVTVTGFVDDPQPLLARCRAFIVPVRAGGGMRVKIVEGWQRGLPLVSTTIGAEGITTHPGEDILLADTPADFAAAVIRTLTEPDLNQQLRDGGRRTVLRDYDWRQRYQEMETIYRELQPGMGA